MQYAIKVKSDEIIWTKDEILGYKFSIIECTMGYVKMLYLNQ